MSSLSHVLSMDDKVTYQLSLDDLDLSFLPIDCCMSKYARRDSAIWSLGSDQDKEYALILPDYNTEYCEIEVLAERKDCNANIEDSISYRHSSPVQIPEDGTTHCPICQIDVKNCFVQNHLKSVCHSKMLKLAKIGSSRLQQYKASILNKCKEQVKKTSRLYCNLCNSAIESGMSLTVHTSTNDHQVSMNKEWLMTDFINRYETGIFVRDCELREVSVDIDGVNHDYSDDKDCKDEMFDELQKEIIDVEVIEENSGVVTKISFVYKVIGAVIFVSCIIFTVMYEYFSMYNKEHICGPVISDRLNDDENYQLTSEGDSRIRTDNNKHSDDNYDELCSAHDCFNDTAYFFPSSTIVQEQVQEINHNEIDYKSGGVVDVNDDKEHFETLNKAGPIDMALKQFGYPTPDHNKYFYIVPSFLPPAKTLLMDKNTDMQVSEDIDEEVTEETHNIEPYCEVCNVYPGVGNLNHHLVGRKHANKLKEVQSSNDVDSHPNETTDQNPKNKKNKKKKIIHSKWEKGLPKKKQRG